MRRVIVAPWTERLFQVLEQAPRPLAWVISETRGLVPPGRAWREREKDRRRLLRYRDRESPADEPSEDKIRYGQNRVVRMSIDHLVKNGRLQYFEKDGQRWIRLGRDRIIPTFEQYSAAAKKGNETRRARGTPRARISDEARQRMRAAQRRAWESLSPEEKARRVERIRRMQAPEKRAEQVRKYLQGLTPEQRSQRSRKGWETRRSRGQ